MEGGAGPAGRGGRRRLRTLGTWRALAIGFLAARALGAHGPSPDSEVTVTFTNYRICVLHACSRRETERQTPGRDRTASPGTER